MYPYSRNNVALGCKLKDIQECFVRKCSLGDSLTNHEYALAMMHITPEQLSNICSLFDHFTPPTMWPQKFAPGVPGIYFWDFKK